MSVILYLLSIIILFVSYYFWKNWSFYYHISRIPGPSLLSQIKEFPPLLKGMDNLYKLLLKTCEENPSIFKIGLGPKVFIMVSEPDVLKVVFNECLDKYMQFDTLTQAFYSLGLPGAPVDAWRRNRKRIRASFKMALINSFTNDFVKTAKGVANDMERIIGKESVDVFPIIVNGVMDSAIKNLGDVDPAEVNFRDDFFSTFSRIVDVLIHRNGNPFSKKFLFAGKSLALDLLSQSVSFAQKLIDVNRNSREVKGNTPNEDRTLKKQCFLNLLLDSSETDGLTLDYIRKEFVIMLNASTQTVTTTISAVLVILGLYPDIQEKVFEEIDTILQETCEEISLEEINRMNYLERVINETLRVLPALPFLLRVLDKDIPYHSGIIPLGSTILIPVVYLHRKPDLWPDPLKFDPDRFLMKRDSCSYVPFSYGSRNCIGLKYAMLQMKIFLATILQRYKVASTDYKSIEEFDFHLSILTITKNGYKIRLERREK